MTSALALVAMELSTVIEGWESPYHLEREFRVDGWLDGAP